jgi:8-oxo-dGTP pyrophosphatase MutT (NUDIX family)
MGCASGKDNNAETPPAHAGPRAGDEPASSSQPPCGLAPLPANAPVRAVVVLCVSNGRALILRRGKTAPWAPGMWSLPGGKVDRGETVLAAGERELGEETDLVPVGARALGAPYVHAPGGAYGMAAVLCGCESEAPIGQSSEFEGGLPVSPELGFPENDAWRWITAAEIREYEQPTEANYRLLAEALRRAEDAPAQAGGLATRI